MTNLDLLKNKMEEIQNYLKELEPILNYESREIIEDNLKIRSVERLFQLIVDTAIDINTHIINFSNFSAPEDYQNTFIILGENKVLPMDFAITIAPSVGLRNLIVHKYGRVDVKKMIDNIKSEISQYLEYLKFIDNFLEK